MKTNSAGKGKVHVSTSIPSELAERVEDRAASLGKSKGAYIRDILVDWYESGCQPVNEVERKLAALEGGKSKEGNRPLMSPKANAPEDRCA